MRIIRIRLGAFTRKLNVGYILKIYKFTAREYDSFLLDGY